ncbi:hypothetical protein THAOC_26743 [Thalassiosira oceanica]|uniref:Uncharacterized protein n=1 Tax=Thalassiosira oceanica TaxID=159749 RepID=K0RY47_THAOC|nr:hypothetical protein THAOC_26743 [Thalassiosira oceanica]|eukprot:EJK53751.1 hypothetical protein THAOC_26743 [Thalassiosira oceanica]
MVHIEVLGGEEQGLNANDGNMANANHIYVHHIDEEAPQEQAAPVPVQQQMAQIPMPMPMPMFPGYPGYNMYGYPGGGGGVIILNQEKEKEEKPFECPHCPKPLSEAEKALRDLRQQIKDEKAEKAKAAKEREKMMQQQAEEQKKRQAAAEAEYLASLPSKFAHSSIASVVLFILAFVFGTVAVTQTYDAFESTSEGRYTDLEGLLEDPIYITNRTYALAAGLVAVRGNVRLRHDHNSPRVRPGEYNIPRDGVGGAHNEHTDVDDDVRILGNGQAKLSTVISLCSTNTELLGVPLLLIE